MSFSIDFISRDGCANSLRPSNAMGGFFLATAHFHIWGSHGRSSDNVEMWWNKPTEEHISDFFLLAERVSTHFTWNWEQQQNGNLTLCISSANSAWIKTNVNFWLDSLMDSTLVYFRNLFFILFSALDLSSPKRDLSWATTYGTYVHSQKLLKLLLSIILSSAVHPYAQYMSLFCQSMTKYTTSEFAWANSQPSLYLFNNKNISIHIHQLSIE